SVPAHLSVEEIVCLESFQRYCLGVGMADQLLWEEWIRENPSRAADVEEAKKLFQVVSARQGNRREQLQQLRQGIQQSEAFQLLLPEESVASEQPLEPAPTSISFQIKKVYQYSVGLAAALAVLALAYLFLFPSPRPALPEAAKQPVISKDHLVTIASGS